MENLKLKPHDYFLVIAGHNKRDVKPAVGSTIFSPSHIVGLTGSDGITASYSMQYENSV